MERNKPKKSVISTGTTSIVLIFVMLSMLTFSVLSLTSAQANLRLSRRSAERTTDYYDAENAANDILIQINSVLENAYPLATSEEDYYAQVRQALEGNDLAFSDDDCLAYEVPLGESQILAVELSLAYEVPPGGRHYAVTAWQAVSRYDWSPDDTLDLMNFGALPTF